MQLQVLLILLVLLKLMQLQFFAHGWMLCSAGRYTLRLKRLLVSWIGLCQLGEPSVHFSMVSLGSLRFVFALLQTIVISLVSSNEIWLGHGGKKVPAYIFLNMLCVWVVKYIFALYTSCSILTFCFCKYR